MEDVMATDDARKIAAKKAAAIEAAAKKKLAAAKKAAAAKKKLAAAKKAAAAKEGHPAPISGELMECKGKIGIQVGEDFYPLETLAEGHDDAQLTLKFRLSQEKLARPASDLFLQLAGLLNTFLKDRAFGGVGGGATCCHNSERVKADDDK